MTKKEILEAAEANSLNYCIQRGIAKSAFIDGALWAMQKSREIIEQAKNSLETESYEEM